MKANYCHDLGQGYPIKSPITQLITKIMVPEQEMPGILRNMESLGGSHARGHVVVIFDRILVQRMTGRGFHEFENGQLVALVSAYWRGYTGEMAALTLEQLRY